MKMIISIAIELSVKMAAGNDCKGTHYYSSKLQKKMHKVLSAVPNTLILILVLKAQETKIVDFANSIAQDEAAHHELPQLDLHCLPSNL